MYQGHFLTYSRIYTMKKSLRLFITFASFTLACLIVNASNGSESPNPAMAIIFLVSLVLTVFFLIRFIVQLIKGSAHTVKKVANTFGSNNVNTGKRGGKFHINKNGNKTYIK